MTLLSVLLGIFGCDVIYCLYSQNRSIVTWEIFSGLISGNRTWTLLLSHWSWEEIENENNSRNSPFHKEYRKKNRIVIDWAAEPGIVLLSIFELRCSSVSVWNSANTACHLVGLNNEQMFASLYIFRWCE